MCGIAGILSMKAPLVGAGPKLEAMIEVLHHRGPDGTGYYISEHVGLGHARLSIIDLEGGKQPIHNEDKSVWVVFNGEIFNYVELRADLEKKGHSFYTKSDTEVIVHLYEEYGDEFVNHLNGQFAIALWDIRKKRLVLVRDRIGIVPLFYEHQNDIVTFASEVKAINKARQGQVAMNLNALDELMTFWAPLSPETVFEGIYEVSPGKMIVFENGQRKESRYWEWAYEENGEYYSLPEERIIGELHDLLIDATRIRLRSDVPVGAYLSGGLDSSVLVAMIYHYGNVPLRTFSIEFEEKGLDESEYQKQLIEHVGTNHSRIKCANDDIAANFPGTVWHTESPILRTAPVPMGILSGLVRKNDYKVVLTGEGSDEVLGGYDIFKETKIRKFWSKNPESRFRPLILKRLYPYLDIGKKQSHIYLKKFFGEGLDEAEKVYFSHIPRWSTTSKCKEFFSDDVKSHITRSAMENLESTIPDYVKEWNYFHRAQYLESKTLMSGYLLSSQGDRMLMKNSVEGRFPFLDHRVIEFANRIPAKLKMRVLNEKYILKKSMSKYLPQSITKRYKQPYRAPDIPAFFSGSTREYVETMLSDEVIRNYGYFDEKKVGILVKKIRKGMTIGFKDNMALVGVLSTQLWHQQFVDGNK